MSARSDPPTAPRTGGRVRSQDAHDDVLRAAAELLEEHGYRDVTIERIAERANVAKSTIYRWWRSKGALVMEAYAQAAQARTTVPDTGAVAEDLAAYLTDLYGVVRRPARVQALRAMIVEAQLDPDFAGELRRWIEQRRSVVATLLQRGVARGELRNDLDVEHAVDLVFGPFWYRLLVEHQPLRPTDAARHAAQLLDGMRPRAARPAPPA